MLPAQDKAHTGPFMLRRAVFVLGIAALTLSGCDKGLDIFGQNTAKAPATAPKPKPVQSTAKNTSSPPPPGATKTTCSTEPPDKVPELVGMDQNELQQVLGKPTAVATKAPGQTWSYRNRCCELSVALYPNLQTHSYQVLSYEVISDDRSDRNKHACVADFSRYDTARTDSGK